MTSVSRQQALATAELLLNTEKILAVGVRWLATRAVDLAHGRKEHLQAGGVDTPWPIYDAINGLAGIGRVLLAALTAGYDTAESGLLAALETLTAMIDTQRSTIRSPDRRCSM